MTKLFLVIPSMFWVIPSIFWVIPSMFWDIPTDGYEWCLQFTWCCRFCWVRTSRPCRARPLGGRGRGGLALWEWFHSRSCPAAFLRQVGGYPPQTTVSPLRRFLRLAFLRDRPPQVARSRSSCHNNLKLLRACVGLSLQKRSIACT